MADETRNVEIINVPGFRAPFGDHFIRYHGAIGYLAMWAHESKTLLYARLCVDQEGNIFASYWPSYSAYLAKERCAYAIMGQRDQQTGEYSFHS